MKNTIICCSVLMLLAALPHSSSGAASSCPAVDPLTHVVFLPHPTNCSLFYMCDNGVPKLTACPGGLHFNPVIDVCDWPANAGCIPGRHSCPILSNSNGSTWSPASCVQSPSQENDICTLTCSNGFELSGGKTVECQKNGWMGINGLDQIPNCKLVSDLGGGFIDRINKTIHGRPANLVFLLDMSGSVAKQQFEMEIQFMNALVAAFPLGKDRSAAAISFDSRAIVNIRLDTSDTCSFMDQADLIQYQGGGTNIQVALQVANQEIKAWSAHNFTLVFLITDGESQTDPSVEAENLKRDGHALFTIGIANYSPSQLIPLSSVDEDGVPIFFGIDSFEIFEKVAEYLETAYNNGALDCDDNTVPA